MLLITFVRTALADHRFRRVWAKLFVVKERVTKARSPIKNVCEGG